MLSPLTGCSLPLTPQDMNNAKLFSDEAANIYERAIGTLLKKNMLLYFSFADYEEVGVACKATYKYNKTNILSIFLYQHVLPIRVA